MELGDQGMEHFNMLVNAGEESWTAHEDKWFTKDDHALRFWTWNGKLDESTNIRIKSEWTLNGIEVDKAIELMWDWTKRG
jgi:hypothetical protein